MKHGVYSAKKLKFYMYYKYLWVKILKLSNCAQIMLFVGLELVSQVFVGL